MKVVVKGDLKVSEKDLRKVNKNSESRITAEVIIFGEEPKLKSPVF